MSVMNTDQFADEVHQRLLTCDQKEAEHDPHGVLMRIARQVAFHHPIAWAKQMWFGRSARRALREREHKQGLRE